MVYHVGERNEHVRFVGGPFDGQARQFCPEMMSMVYLHGCKGEPGIYRLHRIANPDRKGRGWIDLQYVWTPHDDDDKAGQP